MKSKKRLLKKQTQKPLPIKHKPHKHRFMPAIAFDWQDNAIEYGICECGERDL